MVNEYNGETNQSEISYGMAPATESSAATGIVTVVIVIGVLLCAYVSYEIFINNKNIEGIIAPLVGDNQEIKDIFSSFLGGEEKTANNLPAGEIGNDVIPPLSPIEPNQGAGHLHIEENNNQNLLTSTAENPYQDLPNSVIGELLPLSRMWSPQEEDIWQNGITHQFPYQHFKTVHDVVAERLSGSETILWSALESEKLWTRMWAVMGIASFRGDLEPDTIVRGLGDARPSLITNFFKRFMVESSPSQRYVLRHAIRIVNPAARRVILEVLARHTNELNDRYVVAATLDQNARIKAWAKRNVKKLGLQARQIEHLEQTTPEPF